MRLLKIGTLQSQGTIKGDGVYDMTIAEKHFLFLSGFSRDLLCPS